MLVHFVHLTSCILPDSQLFSTPASSQVLPRNPRSESKFRISIASNLHHDAGFFASTYTDCKLRIASISYPRFDFRSRRQSMRSPRHRRAIAAGFVASTYTKSKLRIASISYPRFDFRSQRQSMRSQRHRLQVIYISRERLSL